MTTPSQGADSPRRPAPITAQRGRHAPDAETVESALTQRGKALAALLPEVLAEFEPEISADIDEVVCRVAPGRVAEVAANLKREPGTSMKFLRLVTIVDYEEADGELEAVYHLYSLEHRHKMVLKARVPADEPVLPTVTGVWRGADWYEREMHDLFGVRFEGHPDFRTLILPDGFEGYPGRKSFPLHEYDEW